ncbi:MAG: FtsX-like permease family protein [Cytophagales bacterium]|nr:FtsX-like permease family protein [Cytophagales bacterium]
MKVENSHVTLFLQKYCDQYLFGRFENGKAAGGRIEYVKLFLIVAIVILVIACVNFMNLSTAQASRKAREVGIKKAVGAERSSLIVQYFTETMMISFMASLSAVIVASLFTPIFNNITDKHILIPMRQPIVLLGMVAIAIFTGIFAGSYPALFLSGFKPTDALRGQLKGTTGEFLSRKGLVIFQFSVSVILITAVLVLFKQIEFTQNKYIGYNRTNLIKITMVGKVRSNSESFIQEVKKIPGVLGASSLGHNLVGRNNNTRDLEWPGKHPDYDILFEQLQIN